MGVSIHYCGRLADIQKVKIICDELVTIAFTRYTRHVHPYLRRECTCLELIDGLVRQRTDRRHLAQNALLARAAWACERLNL